MNQNKKTAREAAFGSLTRTERDKSYSNIEIDSAIKRFGLIGAEKGLYTNIVYGVIEHKLTLDYFISLISERPLVKLDPEVLTILRMGLYQLIWLDRVPESAAVNESVKLAKEFKPSASSFVNAALRNFQRRYGKELPYPDKSDRLRYLSVRYSCGEDVVRILESYGDAEPMLKAFSGSSPVTLRVNTLKTTRVELLGMLERDGIEAAATITAPDGIKLKNLPERVRELIGEGLCFIQDEASQLAVEVLDPKPGETVLDVCACPGGKSFSAAMKMGDRGLVKAFDLHKNKLSLVKSGAERLGIHIIEVGERNGAERFGELDGVADAIICDAPCSGLGVIAKKPEIRYKSAVEISGLPKVQRAILSNSANYLKRGGRICYSTCTLNPEENQGVVKRFLAENPEFEPVEFELGALRSESGMLTLFPQDSTDGFFISLMRKR